MKFTRASLLETLRRKNEGWTTYQARKIAGVSARRVRQVWKEYNDTGTIPKIGRRAGRPPRPVTDEERRVVGTTWEAYRVSATTLARLIERDHGMRIGHNRIHRILLELGRAKPRRAYHRRKASKRYERRHSLTAVHADWHVRTDGSWTIAIVDDTSRFLLALNERSRPTTDETIRAMRTALAHGTIRQCITDNGSQFTSDAFRAFLKKEGTRHITCRIHHPQTNGKVEKWFDTYTSHKDAFPTKETFVAWYNEKRPHRALRFDELETPTQAFERKQRPEVSS